MDIHHPLPLLLLFESQFYIYPCTGFENRFTDNVGRLLSSKEFFTEFALKTGRYWRNLGQICDCMKKSDLNLLRLWLSLVFCFLFWDYNCDWVILCRIKYQILLYISGSSQVWKMGMVSTALLHRTEKALVDIDNGKLVSLHAMVRELALGW